jgi:hypothetical protein
VNEVHGRLGQRQEAVILRLLAGDGGEEETRRVDVAQTVDFFIESLDSRLKNLRNLIFFLTQKTQIENKQI